MCETKEQEIEFEDSSPKFLCAYMAIPIEAMDKLETDLGLLKELVRRGQTEKAYRFIEVLEEDLFDKNGIAFKEDWNDIKTKEV